MSMASKRIYKNFSLQITLFYFIDPFLVSLSAFHTLHHNIIWCNLNQVYTYKCFHLVNI